jgi:hypothetical protein
MTYSKKSDCLDVNAIPLDVNELKLLKHGDRLIVENHLPGGSKIYTRGILLSGFKGLSYPASSLCINNERTSDKEPYGHSCTTLYSTFIDSSGKYKNCSDERSIYRDPDLETDRHYSYPVETQIAGKAKAFELIFRRLNETISIESKAQGLESIDLHVSHDVPLCDRTPNTNNTNN